MVRNVPGRVASQLVVARSMSSETD